MNHRYPQWPEFPVFLWNVDSPHSPRQVTMFFQFTFDLIEKRPFTFRTRFDVVYYDAVNSRRTLVGLHPRPCCLQHVASIDAVIQRIKPKLWLLLRLSIQLLSQLRNFLRQSGLHPGYRLFRSRIVIQAGLPHLTKVIVSSQAPSLHGCYPLPRYYEPVRLPNIAARVVIDSHPVLMTPLSGAGNSIPSSRCWVSQVPRLISTRALSPLTPEGSSSALARCFPDDARLHHLRQLGRLHWFNEAETSSLALRLTRSPCEAPHAPLLDTHARLATCQTGNYSVGSFHPTRSARLGLAHRRNEEDEESPNTADLSSSSFSSFLRGLSQYLENCRHNALKIPCRHHLSEMRKKTPDFRPEMNFAASKWRESCYNSLLMIVQKAYKYRFYPSNTQARNSLKLSVVLVLSGTLGLSCAAKATSRNRSQLAILKLPPL
jgi:hypothetical protein